MEAVMINIKEKINKKNALRIFSLVENCIKHNKYVIITYDDEANEGLRQIALRYENVSLCNNDTFRKGKQTFALYVQFLAQFSKIEKVEI